jgi:pimeloyl-ACP methyl ester carboxylesterase
LEEARAFSARVLSDEVLSNAVDISLSCTTNHFEDAWKDMVEFNVFDQLPSLQVPTLVVAGAADSLLPFNLRDFQQLSNATLHVFSRVAHGIPREAAKELAECIHDFCEHGVVTYSTLVQRWIQKRKSSATTTTNQGQRDIHKSAL